MSRRSGVLLAGILLAGAAPAGADDLPPGEMVDRFIEYVYSAHPRDQHGLEQISWLLHHCAQPLCGRLEHQLYSRPPAKSIATVLAMNEAAPGQWEADIRLDTTDPGSLVLLHATVLLDKGQHVTTFMSRPQ